METETARVRAGVGQRAHNLADGIQHADVRLTIIEIQAKGEPASDGSGGSGNDGLVAP